MIDTIEFKTRASLDNLSLNKMQMSSGQNIVYIKPGGQNATSYSYRLKNDMRMPRIKYAVESNVLTVTIPSLGYYMFGSSIIPFSEVHLNKFYTKIVRDIQAELNITFQEHPSNWDITTMDVYHDFKVGPEIKEYLYALGQHSYIEERYKQHKIADETVAWRCGSKEIRFYDKQKKAKDTVEDAYTINNSKGILRFECNIKKAELKRRFGYTNIESVVKDTHVRRLLIEHLKMVGKWNGIITNEVELFKTIKNHVKSQTKASSMMWYIRSKSLGIELNLSRSTIQNYEKEFKKMGILPVIANKHLPPLEIKQGFMEVNAGSSIVYILNNGAAVKNILETVTIPKNRYVFSKVC